MRIRDLLMVLLAAFALAFTGAGMTGCEADVDHEPDGYEVQVERDDDWDDREYEVKIDD